MDRVTTKECPVCGNTHLVEIRTYNEKRCTDCGAVIGWYLDEGQKPLH